jgi:hypothetical protein
MESPEVSSFRHYVLEASWDEAEDALITLGVTNEESLMASPIFLSQVCSY